MARGMSDRELPGDESETFGESQLDQHLERTSARKTSRAGTPEPIPKYSRGPPGFSVRPWTRRPARVAFPVKSPRPQAPTALRSSSTRSVSSHGKKRTGLLPFESGIFTSEVRPKWPYAAVGV